MDDAPDGYFTSFEGSFIPVEWEQFYHYCRFGRAPTEWRKVFEDDDSIGVANTESAGFIQPISGGRA